ncbi:AAA family ATPase [Corynebacterium variabile]|uniref:AAA family ATPase n=1 Tax=Corynebacterium variabile TaxID=1727 RepID=UPI0028A913E6|nr:AAA family ATPase [Corynebacterium variabile]
MADATIDRATAHEIAERHGLGKRRDKAVAQAEQQTATEQTADTPRRRITFTPASKIRTEAIDWLLDCWVPRGSVTLLGGREGIGKSTIAVDWVAQATTGKLTGTPMNVAYVVTEDSPEHTVVPRLKAAGADLDRVLFLAATVPDPDKPGITYESSLDLPGDYPILKTFITEQSIGLVVLDAAKSVMSSKLKGNDDLDIRRFLEPMHRVAQGTGCTFVCLVHFSAKKGSADTGNLIMGSSAWQQVARSVVAVAEDRDNSTVKVWNSKANLAPRIRTMEAQVVTAGITTDDGLSTEVGRIEWIGECDEDGSALLNPEVDSADTDRTAAEAWLSDFLKGCERPKKEVVAEARKDGLTATRTLERAFKKLGGKSEQKGFPSLAHWSLPGDAVSPPPPRASERGETGGTGDDLRKQGGEPVCGATPSGEPSGEPVAPATTSGNTDDQASLASSATATRVPHLAAVPDPDDPVRAAILDALDDTGKVGSSNSAIGKFVKEVTGDEDAAYGALDEMVREGILRVESGRYFKAEAAA